MSEPDTLEPAVTRDGASEPIDTVVVRRLADILNETGLTSIEVERGDLKIRVAREAPRSGSTPPVTFAAVPLAASPQAVSEPPMREDLAPPAADLTIRSPMVGTVYLQPQPGSAAFAKVGDRVTQGQTLCIIEAMKTMNPVAATRAGVVRAFLVADGQPVEYGEPLVSLD